MSRFVRGKRSTDLLDENAIARLVGAQLSYATSGSAHSSSSSSSSSSAPDEDDDFPCLSKLVHGFLEDDPDAESSFSGYESDPDRVDSVTDGTDLVEDLLRSTFLNESKDSYRNILVAHVAKALEKFSRLRDENNAPVWRRNVMSFLRELGHNAAICKTKWQSSGGLTSGSYEFIDVVVHSSSSASAAAPRYIVDLEFSSQFEIARPTSQYSKMLQLLPRVYVGKSDGLKRIVKAVSDVARRSLKSRELSLPPWRKNRYMQNKWFGPYRRTVNSVAAKLLTSSVMSSVKCRCVGFDDAAKGPLFVRTR